MPAYKYGNKWEAKFQYTDWTGEKKAKHKRGFTKKSDALQWERDFLSSYAQTPNMKFSILYDLYMEHCKNRNRKSTVANKKNMAEKHIIPYFGNKPVNEITPADITKWQNELIAKDFKPTYLRSLHSKLSAIFNFAVTFYKLPQNPCRVAGTMGSKRAGRIDFWTLDEFRLFIPSVENKFRSQLGLELLYWTGMRIGELLALTPEDFKVKPLHVRIDETWQIVEGEEEIGPPKSHNGLRLISVPETIYNKVFTYIGMLYECKDTDRIFEGTSKYYFKSEIVRGCEATGVKPIRVHDLRHSHVALLIELGYNDYMIAERIGDTVEEVQKTYAHLYPDKNQKIGEHLEQLQV